VKRIFVFLLLCFTATGQVPAAGPDQNPPVKLNITNQPALGRADAPVTIVEFGDFQCPSCRAEAPVLRQLIPDLYPGKVRVVFKDYPLESIHPWARAAAIAARCVFHQNPEAFWKFYDWDYENQDQITVETLKPKVLAWAGANGVNTAQLDRCIETKATDAEVTRNVTEGREAGVKGTPSVFINGRKAGSGQVGVLQSMIDAEIASHGTGKNRK
jgi:protein-disulfide isomerase